MFVRIGFALGLAATAVLMTEAVAQEAPKPSPAPARVATADPQQSAAETPPAPTAAPVAEPQDPLGIALKQLLSAQSAGGGDPDQAELQALKTFYGTRTYQPLWVQADGMTAKGEAAIAEIKKADDWGLEARAFTLPEPVATPSPEALAAAELTLSKAVLKYVRFAHGGRIMNPAGDLSSYLDRTPQLIEPAIVLDQVASADAADAYLRAQHPQHPQFEKLRQAYLKLRDAAAAPEMVTIPSGPLLKPGVSHPQVALLRQRLKVGPAEAVDDKPADDTLYDEKVKAAVVAFQEQKGLSPDGLVGAGTRSALNDFEVLSTDKLLANMEEWRWMPADMGDFYVWVNVPEFTVRVIKNGEVIHTERVITGLIDKQTPVFSEDMKMVTFRPRWNVPNSIKVRELYPSLARGGAYFDRQNLRLSKNGRVIDPYSVDWSSADIRRFDVYQPSGEGNALGLVKFSFPNKHLVYMHDTPSKSLFDRSTRAFSHGCMRVRNPARLAEILLQEDQGWEAAKVDQLMASGPDNNEVQLQHHIPVHVTYFTAWVDDKGETQMAGDIYGHEKRINQALEGQWSQIAKGPNHLAPVQLERVDDGGGFFSWGGGGSRKNSNSVGDLVQSILSGGF